MRKAGKSEQEAEEESTFWATRDSSLWQALKDVNADISKEDFLKERTQRIENLPVDVKVDKQGNITPESEALLDEARERIAIMEENGATPEEIQTELENMGVEGGRLFSRVGYASMKNPLEGTALSTSHYGEGEGGTMTHVWGNYVLFDPILNKWFYYDEWSGINKYVFYKGDKPYGVIREIIDGTTTKEKATEDINKLISESKQIIAENEEKIKDIEESYPNGLSEGFKNLVEKYKWEIEQEKEAVSENEKTLQEVNDFDESEVEIITYYPKMKYDGKEIDSHKGTKSNLMWHFFEESQTKEQFDEAIKDEIDRSERRIEKLNDDLKLIEEDLSPSEIEKAKGIIKKAKKHSDILEKGEALEHLFGEDKTFSQYKDILWDIE